MGRFAARLAFFAFSGAALSETQCAGAHDGGAAAPAPTEPMVVQVDARDAPQMMLHAKIRVPARGGRLTLAYPKWIPGEHGPRGTVADISGLRISAEGKSLAWHRDPVQTSEFLVDVPAGTRALDVDLDVTVDTRWHAGADVSDLNWDRVLVYPKGVKVSDLQVDAKVRLPEGWRYATALTHSGEAAGEVSFARVSLETLVDSPVIMGRYGRTFDLGNALGAGHSLEIMATSREDLEADEANIAAFRRLVQEAAALFGAQHYGSHYTFLLTLACPGWTGSGLEHQASSQNCETAEFLREPSSARNYADLLPHEFAHAWSGKYRRPRGLVLRDYQEPMHNELLWVYEGLAEYLGWVLAARSGMNAAQDAKDLLAYLAAKLEVIPGRKWRSVGDTVYTPALDSESNRPWYSAQRYWDFLQEGSLIWLEADTVIRQRTSGQRSLDDFVRLFHGGTNADTRIKPYDLPEVLATLNAVAPYDWPRFFQERVYTVSEHAALGGILASGWRLAYREAPNGQEQIWERSVGQIYERHTLGLNVDARGAVTDVLAGSPAARAGVTLGTTVVAVNGRKYTPEVLRRAIADNKGSKAPIELLTERDGFYLSIPVIWAGGGRHPSLIRDESKPDLLASILAPHAPHAPDAPDAGIPSSDRATTGR